MPTHIFNRLGCDRKDYMEKRRRDEIAEPKIIPPHGGYRALRSYQMAEIIHDATVVFCNRFIDVRSRTNDQMVQAARSGKQNIAEGCMASGTSKKTELKLVGVARASLEELLLDFQDYLRQHGLPLWDKNHPPARKVRGLCYQQNRIAHSKEGLPMISLVWKPTACGLARELQMIRSVCFPLD
jgi:four helix bundle protein